MKLLTNQILERTYKSILWLIRLLDLWHCSNKRHHRV